MSRLQPSAPIVAITYGDGQRVAFVMDRIASHLASEGYRLAGLVQRAVSRPGRSRCDMLLEDLTTGNTVSISQDRGAGARGCHLDVEALLGAMARARKALGAAPDLLIVNKFGKTECEGGGCRPLIAEAVEREVPVLVAVPWGNLDGWRRFACDLAAEYRLEDLPSNAEVVCRHLGLIGDGERAGTAMQESSDDLCVHAEI